jgi:anti-sigma regulatory factor (Ser/Thr protein kinase)
VRPYLSIPVTEPSQVGEARRAAARLAEELGFDEASAGRAALVVTELGTNLARHAQGGRLLIGCRHAGTTPALEVLSTDQGPGMADVDRCLRDGFSSGSTPGTGLGAVRRLADEFSVFSSAGHGTVVLARLRVPAPHGTPPPPTAAFEVAGLCIAAPGETVSGDGWGFRIDAHQASLMVADGLGHGPVAAEASDAALSTFASATGRPSQVLERAHQQMRHTRGAAIALASLDAAANRIAFAGVGNIVGRLVSGVEDRTLLSQHGTVGLQIRRLADVEYEWPAHSLLVLHSDGITSRWTFTDTGGLLQCDPAVIAAWLIREHFRGRDDATVVVVRRG